MKRSLSAVLFVTACSGAEAPAPPASPPAAPRTPPAAADPRAPEPAHPTTAAPGADGTGAAARRGKAPSRVEKRSFASASLGVEKGYVVYLPRGYDDGAARFPVVYLLHGLGGNEGNWVAHGGLAETANRLDLPAIVVMPDGDDGFYVNGHQKADYAACLTRKPPWDGAEAPASYCVKTPAYEDYLTGDLVREVDGTLRTVPERASRAIGGLSMGGFGATQLAMRHTELYSVAASFSGMVSLRYAGPHPFAAGKAQTASPASFGGPYPAKFKEHVRAIFGSDPAFWEAHDPTALAAKLPDGALTLFLSTGDKDDFQFEDHAAHLHEVLESHGVPHERRVVPGKHTWAVWSSELPKGLDYLRAHLAGAPE